MFNGVCAYEHKASCCANESRKKTIVLIQHTTHSTSIRCHPEPRQQNPEMRTSRLISMILLILRC